MNNDDTQEQPEAASQTGAVGNQLRKAREAKGITIAQVAESQHLRPSVIQSIEDGQYEKIGSELFLKGYVRAYATQVGLDASTVIESLDSELEPLREEAEEARREDPLETIERKKRQKRRVARWTIWILLIAAVVVVGSRVGDMGLYSSLVGQLDNAASTSSDSTTETENDTSVFGKIEDKASALITDGELDAESSSDPDASADDAQPAVGTDLSEPEPAPEPEVQSGARSDDEPQSVVSEQPAVGESTPTDVTESDSPANNGLPENVENTDSAENAADVIPSDEPAPEPEPTATEPAATGDVLTASFTADCWVSVKNAEGTTVVASLKRAGDNLRYQGQGPFRIVLGAADAATLSFNDEVVDLASYPAPNNRIALTLGN